RSTRTDGAGSTGVARQPRAASDRGNPARRIAEGPPPPPPHARGAGGGGQLFPHRLQTDGLSVRREQLAVIPNLRFRGLELAPLFRSHKPLQGVRKFLVVDGVQRVAICVVKRRREHVSDTLVFDLNGRCVLGFQLRSHSVLEVHAQLAAAVSCRLNRTPLESGKMVATNVMAEMSDSFSVTSPSTVISASNAEMTRRLMSPSTVSNATLTRSIRLPDG